MPFPAVLSITPPSHSQFSAAKHLTKSAGPMLYIFAQYQKQLTELNLTFESDIKRFPDTVLTELASPFPENQINNSVNGLNTQKELLNNAIQSYKTQLQEAHSRANIFFGSDPIQKSWPDHVKLAFASNQRPIDFETARALSLNAAYAAKTYTSYIEYLTSKLTATESAIQLAEIEEAARQVAQQQAEEAARQAAQQQAEEAARQAAQQQAEEAARQAAQQQAEEAARQAAQQQAEEAARQAAQQQAEEAARQAAQQQAEEAARQAAQQQAEEAARQAAQQQAEEAARQAAQQQAEEAARQAAQQQAEEAARQAAQQQAEEAARQAAQQQAEEAARQAAQQQAEEAARQAAQQQAEEAARQKQKTTTEQEGSNQPAELGFRQIALQKEAQRAHLRTVAALPQNSYRFTRTSIGSATFSVSAHPGVISNEAATLALRLAVRTAIAGLAVGTGALASPLVILGAVVGVVALAWPAALAKEDTHVSVALPLADFLPMSGSDLLEKAKTNETIQLPYTLIPEKTQTQTRLLVIRPTDQLIAPAVKIVTAKPDPTKISYSVALESPPRTFTWSPADAPGADAISPSPLPIEAILDTSILGSNGEIENPLIMPFPEISIADFLSTIIVFPSESGIEPLLLVFSKHPIQAGEVGPYRELAARSIRDGFDIDHIAARRAVESFLRSKFPDYSSKKIKKILDYAPAMAIPREIHQKFSETYGGRNSKERIALDASNLENAVNSNINALKPALLDYGMREIEIEIARENLHRLAKTQGLY